MNKILVLGAGKSSSSLIKYLLENSVHNKCQVTVADQSILLAKQKVGKNKNGKAVALNIEDEESRKKIIAEHDLVVSLLPPHYHLLAANDCLNENKNLVTASYVSESMELLNDEVKRKGLIFMCEAGLDPGIDHMSAMQIINDLKSKKAKIISFYSATGGLVSPESDDNPWHYKVTWIPRIVILAGQGAAQFLENGKVKYIPYNRLFTETRATRIPGFGRFESYANRDSLSYISKYGLENTPNILRATFRRDGYCAGWNALIKLGLTDDSYHLSGLNKMSYADWVESYLPEKKKEKGVVLKWRVAKFLSVEKESKLMKQLDWLGLFSSEKINLQHATPAQILQQLIETKWKMKETDHDMIVMQHEFIYEEKEKRKTLQSTLIVKGENNIQTAMAKTVGLPLGIIVKLILQNKIKVHGVQIPVAQEVYVPVLNELKDFGIVFKEAIK